MTLLRPQKKTWLWILLAFWLTAAQCLALVHASKHSLVQEQENCLLCNFVEHHDMGPTPQPLVVAAPMVAHPDQGGHYQRPSLAPQSPFMARGPPA